MDKMKSLVLFLGRMYYLKYVVVIVVGVAIVGFLDDNSIWAHMRNVRQINELQQEVDKYTSRYERDQARIRQLNTNPKAIEKIARERYFMKTDDEDIFVLSDDEHDTETAIEGYETIE